MGFSEEINFEDCGWKREASRTAQYYVFKLAANIALNNWMLMSFAKLRDW